MKYPAIYLFCILILFASCKKSEELRFDRDFSALNIWLGTNPQKADSLVYNYAFKSLNDYDTVKFTVRLTGKPSATDREFQLKAIGGDTLRIKKDVNYVFPKYILPANAYTAVFPILIKRSTDFKTTPAKIIFGVKEDSNFKKGIAERSDLTIILKDQFAKPANWDVDPLPYFKLSTFFGAYSDVKFQFITTVIGRAPIFKVRYSGVVTSTDEIYYTQAQYFQNRCKIELVNYNLAHPTAPLKSEIGETITFP
ncbi:DUF4843 domain-containing protein [Pedobacter sp. MW01-1-1]|uniref:DUF4843 domain-containing protein n=1 Tax=Pedobacter sp. MW01-1-1 TaxID=3383027 RepID=UPI003FF0CC8A